MHCKASFFKKPVLIGCLLIAALSVQAATCYVSPSGNDANNGTSWALAKRTIQAAINVTAAGDTVLVADGTYAPIAITQGITVRSVNGAQTTIIDGGGVTRCAYLYANAVLDGFTVINGYVAVHNIGGGVLNNGGTIRNCTISGNMADGYSIGYNWPSGGGVYVKNGMLQNCTISYNIAAAGGIGGGVYADSSIVENCTISGNMAGVGGGVYIMNGMVENCTISGNSAKHSSGGGVYTYGGAVQNCTVIRNSAYCGGGGIFLFLDGTVQNCTITGNTASGGGGIEFWGGSTVRDCVIMGNKAWDGGGVMGYDGTVENCTISGNTAYSVGGVYVSYSIVENCMISENTAGSAGGMYVSFSIVKSCMISGNAADGYWSFGGGVVVNSGTVKNCAVVGNKSYYLGGGVYIENGGTVQNCTISGNSSFYGGGVFLNDGTVQNCVVYYNQIGDVYNYDGAISYSCIGTNIAGVGNITNEPQFVSLGTGYGPDHVPGNYRLRPTSPCINAGLNQSWMAGAIDLDGLPRIVDSVVDMGAYEGLGANNAIMRNPALLFNQCGYGSNAASQTIEVWNAGTNTMTYILSADVGWLSLSPASGTSMGEIDLVSVNYASAGLAPGIYTSIVTITSAEAINSPQVVTVYLSVNEVPQEDLADLEASDFRFLPVNLWAGDHPAMISFNLVNEGPEDIVPPDTQPEITFYLSSNTTLGDEDDLAIGTKTEEITLSAGSQTTLRYPGRTHNQDVTIPEGLSGDFYVFIKVQIVSQSGLSDPDGASAMREGPINVQIHSSDDGDSSGDGDNSGGGSPSQYRSVVNDYDGDMQTDLTSYDESTGVWTIQLSGWQQLVQFVFGGPGYESVPADYDGDSQTDPAIHQRSGAAWSTLLSGQGYAAVNFNLGGASATRGAVGDYMGNGQANPGLYEEQSGRWYVLTSAVGVEDSEIASAVFGGPGYQPVVGDYDGDGKTDPAVYEEATGNWLVMLSGQGYGVVSAVFGGPGYAPVVGDYDGDGKADPMLSTGSEWVGLMSGSGYALKQFSDLAGTPVAGDYDGDGKSDPAVISTAGEWSFLSSLSAYLRQGPYALQR